MLIWAMLLAAASDIDAWAWFSREPALSPRSEKVEVETQGYEFGTKRLRYRMRLTRRNRDDMVSVWADSRECPAVRDTVRLIRTLPVPRIKSPGYPRSTAAGRRVGADVIVTGVLDGTTYSFDGLAGGPYERIAFSGNVGTPLAAWIDARLAALAPCWKAAKP